MPTLVPGFTPPVPQIKDENTSNRASVTTYARYFDGVNDKIAQDVYGTVGGNGSNLGGIGDFTISISFYSLSVSSYRNVFDMNRGYFTNSNTGVRVEQDSNGSLYVIYSSATSNSGSQYTGRSLFSSSDPIRANQWYHFTMTRTGTTVKFYINGYEKESTVAHNSDPNGLDSFPGAFQAVTIGTGFDATSTRSFYGYLSNFKVFDTVLTPEQVLENFQSPNQGVPTGVEKQRLRLWWKLSEGGGYVAIDSSFYVSPVNIARNSTISESCQAFELADSSQIAIANEQIVVTNPSATRQFRLQVPEMVSGRWYRIKMDVKGDLTFLVQIGNGAGGYYSSEPTNGTEYYDFRSLGGSFLQVLTYTGTGKNTYDNIEIYEMSPDVPGFISGTAASSLSVLNNSHTLPALPLESYNVSANNLQYSDALSNITVTAGSVTHVPTGLRPDGRLGYYIVNGTAYFGIGGSGKIFYYIICKRYNSENANIYVNGSAPASLTFNFSTGTVIAGNYSDLYVKPLDDGWYYISFSIDQGAHYSYWANIGNGSSLLVMAMGKAGAVQPHGHVRIYNSSYSGGTVAVPEGMTDGKDAYGMPFMHPRKANSFNFLRDGLAVMYSPIQPTGNQSRTLEAWIYYVSDGGNQSFIELGSGSISGSRFGILAISDNIYIVGQANDYATGVPFTNKAWNHIAATHDGSTLKVYKNGTLVGSSSKTYNTYNIGIRVGNNSRNDEPAASIVMNPKVYNFALTAEQVQSAYNGNATVVGSSQTQSELQAYISRTTSDGATVESHSCLLSLLNELDEM